MKLMQLYAGKISKLYKYSIQNYRDIVTKLYRWDNQQIIILNELKVIISLFFMEVVLLNMRISETLCCSVNINYDRPLSVHTLNSEKPLNDFEVGHYLAGLIDGDGHFSKIGQLVIAYDEKDDSAAYWLKTQIGYGTVSKIKDKKVLKYVLSHSEGVKKVIHLINGKLRTVTKFNQVQYLLNNHKLISNYSQPFTMNTSTDFNNHWLAGFIDSDGSFQIKIRMSSNNPNCSRSKKPEVRLKLQIAQTQREILDAIRLFLAGPTKKGVYIGERMHKYKNGSELTTYYLETTSFSVFKRVANYIDHYPLISHKRLKYMWIRKAYLIVQSKDHIKPEGLKKIQEFKEKMKY